MRKAGSVIRLRCLLRARPPIIRRGSLRRARLYPSRWNLQGSSGSIDDGVAGFSSELLTLVRSIHCIMRSFLPVVLCLTCFIRAQAVDGDTTLKSHAIADIQARYADYKTIALQIWDYAECAYKKVKSSPLLQKTLADNGFVVKAGVAEIPTAFVASYGSGSPVIGILAEFDALPGLSQQAVAEKMPGEGK